MKLLARNKKASLEYNITEVFSAGLVLKGDEVKSIKTGQVSLAESAIALDLFGARLLHAYISPYAHGRNSGDPYKARAMLLNKKELIYLSGMKGVYFVPLEIFSSGRGWIKIKFGLGTRRNKIDKRAHIKKKDDIKQMRRITTR